MSPRRQLLLLAALTLSLTALVKAAQVALTPELYAATATVVRGVLNNVVVQALAVTAGFVVLLALCVAAWERDSRRYARRVRERAEAAAREYRAPCGEVVRPGHGKGLLWTPTPGRDETRSLFPLSSDSSTNDRGPKAA